MHQALPSPPELCQAPLLESRAFEGASDDQDDQQHRIGGGTGYFDRPIYVSSSPYISQDIFSPGLFSQHTRAFAENLRRQTAPYSSSPGIRPGSARSICPPEFTDMEVATAGLPTPRLSPTAHFHLFRPSQTCFDLSPELSRPNHLQPTSASPRQVVWTTTGPLESYHNNKVLRPPLHRLHSGVIPQISSNALMGPPTFDPPVALVPSNLSSFRLSIQTPGDRRFSRGAQILQSNQELSTKESLARESMTKLELKDKGQTSSTQVSELLVCTRTRG